MQRIHIHTHASIRVFTSSIGLQFLLPSLMTLYPEAEIAFLRSEHTLVRFLIARQWDQPPLSHRAVNRWGGPTEVLER